MKKTMIAVSALGLVLAGGFIPSADAAGTSPVVQTETTETANHFPTVASIKWVESPAGTSTGGPSGIFPQYRPAVKRELLDDSTPVINARVGEDIQIEYFDKDGNFIDSRSVGFMGTEEVIPTVPNGLLSMNYYFGSYGQPSKLIFKPVHAGNDAIQFRDSNGEIVKEVPVRIR